MNILQDDSLSWAEHITIIYTDHFAAVFIVCQLSLNTININKLNLWLVQASEYLQRFCLNVQYKFDKINIVSDTLSHLTSCEYWSKTDELFLDALHKANTVSTYMNTLIKMSEDFWKHMMNGYETEPQWQHIINIIQQNKKLNLNTATLPYTYIWGLIYYKSIKKGYCLCIFSNLYQDVFIIAHNSLSHLSYARTHKWLMNNLYLSNLLKHLHDYIHHCQQCQLMQTSQHLSYELMQLILTSLQSFHVIIIDFILTLLLSSEEFNSVMLITDKFSKAVILISEQKTMTVKDWALELLNHLALLNWGLSQAILSDWDCKFTAEL